MQREKRTGVVESAPQGRQRYSELDAVLQRKVPDRARAPTFPDAKSLPLQGDSRRDHERSFRTPEPRMRLTRDTQANPEEILTLGVAACSTIAFRLKTETSHITYRVEISDFRQR